MPGRAEIWCTGYYPGWAQGSMPASNIDFSVVTHVSHFSVIPNADGTLNTTGNGITPAYTADVVARTHAAKRQVLICVGGAGTSFISATSNHLATLVLNLTNFMAVNNYDGIDVDWEPLNAGDKTLFTNFVTHLRSALNGFSSHKLMTTALPTDVSPSTLAAVQSQFDRTLTEPFTGNFHPLGIVVTGAQMLAEILLRIREVKLDSRLNDKRRADLAVRIYVT